MLPISLETTGSQLKITELVKNDEVEMVFQNATSAGESNAAEEQPDFQDLCMEPISNGEDDDEIPPTST